MKLFQWLLALTVVARAQEIDPRVKKGMGVFKVIKFPNIACSSSNPERNGTCYTASECTAKGGSISGSCANGFGVCCIFEKNCGDGSIAENCTYFTSASLTTGSSCSLTVCKCSSDVCQLRLDFETFVLNDPVTPTDITVGTAGAPGAATRQGNCDTDSFGVTVPGGKAPPIICGTNTGQHMYIPASETGCNTLTSNIGAASTAKTSAFTIKVTQIECKSKRLAPSGCLQYFTQDAGEIQTFNYNNGAGIHLANQDYNSCIRANRQYCAICYYTPTATTGFALSVPNGAAGAVLDTNCGAPELLGFAEGGAYDHITIPGGQCDSPDAAGAVVTDNFLHDRYCGTQLGCGTTAAGNAQTPGTVCTNQKPFKIGVYTDGLEYNNPAANGEAVPPRNIGFSIKYFMKTSCLTRPGN